MNISQYCNELLDYEEDNSDVAIEELWSEFGDVPMNPNTECIEAPFLHFATGTHREDIWHWFDEVYSKGVAHLMGFN